MLFKNVILFSLPWGRLYLRYRKVKIESSYFDFLKFKMGFCKTYWKLDKTARCYSPLDIYVGINSSIGRPCNEFNSGDNGRIFIGNYVHLACNIGILSDEHSLYHQDKYVGKDILIGDYSWIGMNSVILKGVKLGPRTIVGAGSVVTKSFPEGFCVIAGNPAKVVKYLDKDKFIPYKYEEEFYGYIPKEQFEKVKHKYLSKEIIEKIENGIFQF
ncbi:acyltransferase [Parabacteroides sp. APC149_11_2_Y6]